ncbi:hypothetical protein [Bradyrhizobium lablabi]|uniref:hypothetical protein n=1 Tax=Bradyrhizobium lablabi TaxID=722472 RepID=UPI001FCE0433|nr:hypothetical protein [Bradyrhizobium lablabi]
MGLTETLEGAFQIPKLVGGEGPILLLRGPPKPSMSRLDRRDHHVTDAGQILSGLRLGQFLRSHVAVRGRQCHDNSCSRRNRENGGGEPVKAVKYFHGAGAVSRIIEILIFRVEMLTVGEVRSH